METLIKFNFNTNPCVEMEEVPGKYSIDSTDTIFRTTPESRLTDRKLSIDFLTAEAIANMYGVIDTNHVAVGKVSSDTYVCEYKGRSGDEYQIAIAHLAEDGWHLKAGLINEKKVIFSYGSGHKGTVMLLSMLPVLSKEIELREALTSLDLISLKDSPEEWGAAMCKVINNLYYRLNYADRVASDGVFIKAFENIRQADMDAIIGVTPVERTSPKFLFFREGEKKDEPEEEEERGKISVYTGENITNIFPYDDKFVPEKPIPQLTKAYVVQDWTLKLARRICGSKKFLNPIKNILLYGSSGTGKTEGCQALAQMLGLPYYTLTCSADDDKFDLVGQLVPNTAKKEIDPEKLCKEMGIPTFDEVENDFAGSFSKLFGRTPGKLDSPADAYAKIAEKMMEAKANNENDFTYVESELIHAIKYGGVCEIQEANLIKRSSVMEALNPLLAKSDDRSYIKLPTGELIQRHPNCIIVFTINRDYEGCNNIQEAVYSRISLVMHINEPTVEELVARTKAVTGFKSMTWLKKMSTTVYDINEYMHEQDIRGGVCGPRELIDWAQLSLLLMEEEKEETITEKIVIEAASFTILQKVAQNSEDIEDIINGVFKKNFSPSIVDKMAI